MPADLIRTLGVLAEPPTAGAQGLSELLGLGAPPNGAEHADVFTFNLYPYASVYLGQEGMLGGEARSRVSGFWTALGIELPSEPDHLTSLLGLFAGLLERSAQEEEESRAVLLREAASACLFEHLVPWTGTYLQAVARHGSRYYGDWARLLSDTLGLRVEDFDLHRLERRPVHLTESEPIRPPSEVGGSAFLDQLLAPARTGMIVTRKDLGRLGREVGLGARVGERRYMLEAYLGQDPEKTLGWLSQHTAGWVDRSDEPLETVRGFWEGRAAHAVEVLDQAAGQASDFLPSAPRGETTGGNGGEPSRGDEEE